MRTRSGRNCLAMATASSPSRASTGHFEPIRQLHHHPRGFAKRGLIIDDKNADGSQLHAPIVGDGGTRIEPDISTFVGVASTTWWCVVEILWRSLRPRCAPGCVFKPRRTHWCACV